MMATPVRKKWIAGFLGLLIIGMGIFVAKDTFFPSSRNTRINKELPESFTFFDLGANTSFSSSVRRSLGKRLGSDSIAYRGQIDLSADNPELLQTFFPDLNKLNLQLNDPPRERIEHNTIKLMYRYSQKNGVPFKYVELVFSGYSHLPLYFSITISDDGSNVIDSLHQKYGKPEKIPVASPLLSAEFWEKNNDRLLIWTINDRYGKPEYHIMIYYVNSLFEILNIEKEEARHREEQIRQAAGKAF